MASGHTWDKTVKGKKRGEKITENVSTREKEKENLERLQHLTEVRYVPRT
jgi:hypothetical protein